MNAKYRFACTLVAVLAAAALAGALTGTLSWAEAPKESKPAGLPDAALKLPPGWTEADMQACILAGTPGKMHEYLAKSAGEWEGKTTMTMFPGAEPMTSKSSSKVTPILDGRFYQCEMTGEMPGMGPYHGMGIYGFDNVSQKFVSTWIDNHGTGMMTGVGDLSADGKTLTWSFTGNCPITKKPIVMREIETITGPDSKTLEMFGPDVKTGKEFKMMAIELTKKSS